MTDYLAAFLLGLVSSGHCMGMCGGLMLAAGLNSSQPIIAVGYNLGRVMTYMLLGASFGAITTFLPEQFLPMLKLLSATLLILTALYLLDISQLVNKVESIGKPLWKLVQVPAKRLLPVKNIPASVALGMLWGFIPCGLVYTALAFSLAQASPLSSGLMMLSFGLGTFPSMIGASLLATRIRPLLTHKWVRKFLATLLLIFAIFMLIQIFQ